MSNMFEVRLFDRPAPSQQNLNLKFVRANQVKFGEKSLKVLGPKIWNNIFKNTENFTPFKRLMKTRDGVSYKCNLCRKI